MSDNDLTEFLTDHPRMIGALFTMLLFLSTTGSAVANQASTVPGP